jgi:hypothetical protein
LYAHLKQYQQRDKYAREQDPYCTVYRWFALEGDFEKLDFTLLPQILTLVSMSTLFFYRDTGDTEYDIFRFMAEWSADSLTSKFLHLFKEEQRLIIGMMFSGNFLTSWGDSVYCMIAFEAWFNMVYTDLIRRSKCREAAHWRSCWPLPLWIYGDDHLANLPEYVYPYVTGKDFEDASPDDKPVNLSDWLRAATNLSLKMSDCAIYLPTPTRPEPLFTDVYMGSVRVPGPKFLQRRFVHAEAPDWILEDDGNYEHALMPFRPIEDYYGRASTTVNSTTWAGYLMKLRGLAVDVAGSNGYAFAFLRFIHDKIAYDHPEAIAAILGLDLENDRQLLEFRRRVADSGLPMSLLRPFPSYSEMQLHYWPKIGDVTHLAGMARKNGNFFNLIA